MNILLTTIGRRGYLADYFRDAAGGDAVVVGTSDRHSTDVEFSPGLLACDRRYLVPSIDTPGYVDSILDICRQEEIGLITSLYDLDAYQLSLHHDALAETGAFAGISSARVNRICMDKVETHSFLARRGFSHPRTWTTLDDCLADKPPYPLLLKARHGFSGIGTRTLESPQALTACAGIGESFIVQELLTGPEYGMDVFNDQDGQVIACIVRRKIAMRAGETDQAITVVDPELIKFGVSIGEALGHLGPLDVDFILTEHGPVVLDLNPRFGGGYPLSHAAGVNFPELMLKMARGERLQPKIGNYPDGLVMVKDIHPNIGTTTQLTAGLLRSN